jgi:hypothetical protein
MPGIGLLCPAWDGYARDPDDSAGDRTDLAGDRTAMPGDRAPGLAGDRHPETRHLAPAT